MGLTRLIRGQVLSLREREFIQAAQVMGVPTRRILFKELLPNLVAPIVVATSLALPGVRHRRGRSVLPRHRHHRRSRRWARPSTTREQYWDTYPLYLWAPVLAIACWSWRSTCSATRSETPSTPELAGETDTDREHVDSPRKVGKPRCD